MEEQRKSGRYPIKDNHTLLYSESYTDLRREVEERGLEQDLEELKQQEEKWFREMQGKITELGWPVY